MKNSYKNHLQRQGFELIKNIGTGLSGSTFKANQASLDRFVAVKFFDNSISMQSKDLKKRFKRESRILAELQSPSIPYVLTFGEVREGIDEIPYFVMQYIPGITLEEYIKENAGASISEIINIANQILDALVLTHEKGIIHRDIKPSNIMITPSGNCYLIDFSIGYKMVEEPGFTRATETGDHLGSFQYMSPEQGKNMKDVDQRSDLYSLSIVLCELITGKPTLSSLDEINSKYINAVKRILKKGAHHDIKKRFIDAAEYKRELNQILKALSKVREKPSKAVCINNKCPNAIWSSSGYYKGPNYIDECTNIHCTSCGAKLIYQCANCGSQITNTQFCGGCGTEQFKIPECEQCSSYLRLQDMGTDTKANGCEKCRSKREQQSMANTMNQSNDFDDDIPF